MLLTVLVVGTLGGCSGGGDGGLGIIPDSPSPTAQFQSSSTPPAADRVWLVGKESSADLITMSVAIGGATTSTDLYSFAFDLVLGDTSVAQYVSGSADIGSALTFEGGQAYSVLVSQAGDRVIIGVSKTGGGAGNGVSASEAAVVDLTFRVLKEGTTSIVLAGPPGEPGPVALDSSGAPIGSVLFDTSSAWIAGI